MHRVLDRQWGKPDSGGPLRARDYDQSAAGRDGKDKIATTAHARGSGGTKHLFLARYRGCDLGSGGNATKGLAFLLPPGSEKEYEGILPSHFDLIPQRGNGFGERLTNAADDLLHVGFESCCLINSDSPTATAGCVSRGGERNCRMQTIESCSGHPMMADII